MIPIALPSAGFFILLSAGFFAGLLLLGWAVVLAISGRARRTVRKYWKTSTLLCLALIAPFSFYAWFQAMMWQLEREIRREEAAHNVTLQEPMTVSGVSMPAGTRLKVQDKGLLDTYIEASFPQAVSILGVQATSARRYLDAEYDKEYNLIGRRPRTVILRGAGEQSVLGWRCDATQDIEFDVAPDGAMKRLTQCVLAAGNQAADLTIGAGAVLRGSNGTVYTDGSRDPDRWWIDIHDDTAVTLFGLALSKPRVYLDEARKLLRVTDAELACPTQFGGLSYPAGTQVKTARRGAGNGREPYPGILVFSPWNGQAAARSGFDDVPEGMSVMQTLQGDVLDVVTNDAAGVFRFDTFIVDGKEPEMPARARCP
ncbi:hypothetical protein [Achromobacter arsenitoxydans]|uniref:Uncharacterized protein n=1 Tax=Achromobacter arsenitoxydans SY8 TaxID=477184 RepID=H0F5V6_9BURK|nr:hypothetical protein [Achromobacter arsenitoxydans]EHK66234.1 hypothetical protein KYC_10748 [Achromobacter arsenitoxydans SY8]